MATYFQSKTREFCIMKNFKKKLLVILLALTGSYFGYLLNLPIGTLVGSFIFIAIAKVIGLNVYPPPKKFKQKIQMVIGGLIGLNLQPNIASLFISLLIPGLIAATVHIIIAFLMAYLLMKLLNFTWLTALTGSIPAGISEISNIIEDIDVNQEIVMLMHIFRISFLILILPILIKYIFL